MPDPLIDTLLLRLIADQGALALAQQTVILRSIERMATDLDRIRTDIGKISDDVGKVSTDLSAIKDIIAGGISAADAKDVADKLDAAVGTLDAATSAMDAVANPVAAPSSAPSGASTDASGTSGQ